MYFELNSERSFERGDVIFIFYIEGISLTYFFIEIFFFDKRLACLLRLLSRKFHI